MDAQALALQFQLEQTEWWPAEKLQAHQLSQIQNVIDHAQATVPLYRKRLAPFAGWGPGLLTMERIREIPILEREEVQAAGKRLHARRLPPGHTPTAPVKTSGSSGKPVEVLSTPVTGIMLNALTMRGHLWHQRDLSAKSLTFRRPRRGGRPGRWAPLPHTGPSVVIDPSLPTSVLFEHFLREDPAYLQSHPFIILGLAQLSAETGRKPGNLRQVRIYGETLDPWVRNYCRNVWGVPVVENYSAEEFGTIAQQCSETENLHVQSENVLVEVLDDQDRPCKPGQSGRVVATSLLNYATPLIRYELGDIVEVGEACPCGRGLPVLRRVRGRIKDLVHLPNGDTCFPNVWRDLMVITKIRQFQMIQTSLQDIVLRLVVTAPLEGAERRSITLAVHEKLLHDFNVEIIYMDNIPREPSGKYREFKSTLGSLEDSMDGEGGAALSGVPRGH
jgi:phenylacetate-CoA ligase